MINCQKMNILQPLGGRGVELTPSLDRGNTFVINGLIMSRYFVRAILFKKRGGEIEFCEFFELPSIPKNDIFETPHTKQLHFQDPHTKNGIYETPIPKNCIFETPHTISFLLTPPLIQKMAKFCTLHIKFAPLIQKMAKGLPPSYKQAMVKNGQNFVQNGKNVIQMTKNDPTPYQKQSNLYPLTKNGQKLPPYQKIPPLQKLLTKKMRY